MFKRIMLFSVTVLLLINFSLDCRADSLNGGFTLNVLSNNIVNTYNATDKEVLLDKITILYYATKSDMISAYKQLSKSYKVAYDESINIEEEKYNTTSDSYMNGEYTVNQMRLDIAQEYAKYIKITKNKSRSLSGFFQILFC